MASPKTFGFDERGVRRIQEMSKQLRGAAAVGSQRRRQVPLMPPGGRGGVDIIRFIIEETNCDRCSALVRVASWPKGRKPTGDTNDYDYDSDLLRVWDLADCFFNAPPLELVGKIGYAVKLYHEDIASPPRCDIQFSERWEVIFLCCQ